MKSASPGMFATCRNLATVAVREVERFVSSLRPAKPIHGESEEGALLRDVVELDRQDPNWYRPNLVIGAQQMLINGSDVPTVSAVYGAEITAEAKSRLRTATSEQRVSASS
jgi:hypothetical protein